MPALPSLTARKVVRALKRAGFIEDRQIPCCGQSSGTRISQSKHSSSCCNRRAHDEVQKLTDSHIAKLDQAVKSKEKEILELK
jgi:ribosome recycling factor